MNHPINQAAESYQRGIRKDRPKRHAKTPKGGIMQNMTSPTEWPHCSVGRAWHQHRRSHGIESR